MKIEKMKAWLVVQDGRAEALCRTREDARYQKAKMGGKENGVSIIQLVAKQEVR